MTEVKLHIREHAAEIENGADMALITRERPLRILPGRREVYSGHWGDVKIVSKCFLPHPKMERDSQREWEGLNRLYQLKLPAPAPLFKATDIESGSIWVVMKFIEDSYALKTILSDLQDKRVKVMAQLADALHAMHLAGARQTDQHIGNWAYDGRSLHLLDAGTVEFKDFPLSESQSIDDFAAISATLDLGSRDTFFDAAKEYTESDLLKSLTVQKQLKRLKKHYKKTRRECTEYGCKEGRGYRGLYSKFATPELVEDFFKNPEKWMSIGQRLKSGNTCTVQGFEFNDRAYVLKRYNLKPLKSRLRKSFKESRALKSWSNAWCLLTAHIPTARPVAVYEERRGTLPGRSYLLMEEISGTLLSEYLQKSGSQESIEKTIESISLVWRSLETIRAVHRDLKATNWIVTQSGEAVVFDLDAMSICLSESAFAYGRSKDYKRFIQNWKEDPELERRFKEALLPG